MPRFPLLVALLCLAAPAAAVQQGYARVTVQLRGFPGAQGRVSVQSPGQSATVTPIDCRRAGNGAVTGTCMSEFRLGSRVTVVATPTATGSSLLRFEGFYPTCKNKQCSFTIDRSNTVRVTFTRAVAID